MSELPTEVVAPADVPTIDIIREFDAPTSLVFRAWTDPELVTQWLGPRDVTMTITAWHCRRGGSWAYTAGRDGEDQASFYGTFHDVRPDERVVQTFTWEGAPDVVALETVTFEELPGGRTRTVVHCVVDSFEARDLIVASQDTGVREGYEQLDDLLALLG